MGEGRKIEGSKGSGERESGKGGASGKEIRGETRGDLRTRKC